MGDFFGECLFVGKVRVLGGWDDCLFVFFLGF